MEITLNRSVLKSDFTLGELSIDGEFFCYTVEDTIREIQDLNGDKDALDIGEGKVMDKTAIPYGRYKVIVNMSNRFKKLMPLLIDVPFFEGIRIHSGANASHSSGCIIVGMGRSENGVSMSRIAFNKLMERLKNQNNIYITIK